MTVLPTRHGARLYRPYAADVGGGWDALVIGSGMGGMSCAAALARFGRRVCLLEQHYVPGGYTHMFARKGFHWDVGVHALGEMSEGELPRRILDWLTDGSVSMVSLGDPYDRFLYPDGFEIDFPATKQGFRAVLDERFPDQAENIAAYFRCVGRVARSAHYYYFLKSLPRWMDAVGSRVVRCFHRDWWKTTVEEVFDEVGIEGRLRNVLSAQWGYFGSVPRDASFAMQALVHCHFGNGAYFPQGGSKSLAEGLLAPVIDAGGEVRTKASVENILVEGGRAVGVRMADGSEVRAPWVISAAGARNTVDRLLPAPERDAPWAERVRSIGDSPSYLCLNLGFEGDIAAAGATPANLWLMSNWDIDQSDWDVGDPTSIPHILYVSFPSLKDPDHDPGPRRRHTGECVTFIPWEAVRRWEETDIRTRAEGYEALKRDITERLLACLRERLPDLMDLLVHHELSTPLTAQYFVQASRGAIYGMEATPARFTCRDLRARTPIPRLLMTGVDSASIGVISAMASGMLTASVLEKRVYLKMV
ncbi:MAG: NAD(P)/FAD-dependent oxidoreductase [Planctomycetota bacterium]|nr:NAD(P)/FAD-dependent oxidoreductase [Planctomycetota bacterium]MDP6761640.1 NAD(P)/FAD-dependent oxidoreductase [Planctomycetota bacterium]MDP6990457.1 NAD(P)/FAD-dependent oxidoreductase [Planctomycetota bacterium]